MNIVDCIFGAAYVLEPLKRTDNRGEMNLCFHRNMLEKTESIFPWQSSASTAFHTAAHSMAFIIRR